MNKKPIIVFFDIETSPIVAATFSLYPESIRHENIIQDWFIISAAWKYQGNKKVYASAINSTLGTNDFEVVKSLRDALEGVDIVVTHNGDKFDLKKLTARLIYHGLPPLPKLISIDTLKEVKKVATFTSHRLDYLGTYLSGRGKVSTSPGLWMSIVKGDYSAIDEMVKYNKVDVIILEELYEKIRPYIKNHPHIGALKGESRTCSCKACGSTNLKKNGTRITAAGLYRQEWQCTNCGAYASYPIVKDEQS